MTEFDDFKDLLEGKNMRLERQPPGSNQCGQACVATICDILGGRMILKSVSVDYLDRKGAKDVD